MDTASFNRMLSRVSPNLKLEFSGEIGCYVIYGVDESGKLYTVMQIPLGQLENIGLNVLDQIWLNTPHLQGGENALIRRLEASEERTKSAAEKSVNEEIDDRGKEMRSHVKWLSNQKIVSSGVGSGACNGQ